jgi:argininosuccinate lyase
MLQFSESVSFDRRLAPFDILVNKAHSAMLAKVGLITKAERVAIHRGLDEIAAEIERGEFVWEERFEDVHMNVEQALTKRVAAAAKLHTARSRNDQVATDSRLFLKSACDLIDQALAKLMATTLGLAERNQKILIPGYTHLQRAQPVSAAHHLLAYVEMFGRDRERFAQAKQRANLCPLGCGALAGTTLPIDRAFTAEALGFVDEKGRPLLAPNSMDAVADRDAFIEFASACAVAGLHLSRVAEDLILWTSQEFRFIDLPDAFCTGSSLMPQKKNPDSLELIRGKSARLQGNLHTLLTLVKGLPLTYNRDLQEDKLPVFDSLDQTLLCLQALEGTLAGLRFRESNCAAAVADPNLLATDLADWLVARGLPFREAHHAVGALVAEAEKRGCDLSAVPAERASEIHPAFTAGWSEVFDLDKAMRRRNGVGMPGPAAVKRELARWSRKLGASSKPKAKRGKSKRRKG